MSSPSSRNSLDETVKEVEDMLKTNPELPRLTRGEILDLLENITKSDALRQNNFGIKPPKSENRDPKVVMLVKPYTPDTDQVQNIEELFTKPPITQIVGAQLIRKPIEDNTINTSK